MLVPSASSPKEIRWGDHRILAAAPARTPALAYHPRGRAVMVGELRVEAPGAILAVRDHGGEGETVLLVHGGPGVPDYLEPVASLLRGMGLRPVTFDQRGSGGSLPTDGSYGLLDHASDVDAVRASIGIERVHVFGHSWGGLLGQLYLAQHPERVRSLFLCSSSPGFGNQWRTNEKEVFAFNRRRAGLLRFAAMGLAQFGMALPPTADGAARRLMDRVWRNYFPDPRSAQPADPEWLAGLHAEPMRQTTRALRDADPVLLDGIGDAQIPVLVEFGGDDIYRTADSVLRRRFPRARHVTLERSGHLPWLQASEDFQGLLEGFYGSEST